MRRLTTVALVALLSLLPEAFGGPVKEEDPQTVEAVVAAVESTYQQVQTMQADFVQVTRSASMGEGEKQRGKVRLKRPAKMRWDFTQPDTKLFVTDGKTMWVWTPSANQVFVTEDVTSGGGATQLLDDLNKLDELFNVVLIDRDEIEDPERRSHILELTPKQEAPFKKLRLVIRRNKYTVEKVTIIDQFDTETELTFSQVRLNQALADSEFIFQIPPGADVIRPDGI